MEISTPMFHVQHDAGGYAALVCTVKKENHSAKSICYNKSCGYRRIPVDTGIGVKA